MGKNDYYKAATTELLFPNAEADGSQKGQISLFNLQIMSCNTFCLLVFICII